jgi:predicted transcriptional regulator
MTEVREAPTIDEDDDEDVIDTRRQYLQKKEAIAFENSNQINLAKSATSTTSAIRNQMKGVLTNIVDELTPEFVNRMKYKKQFPAKIAASEE